MTFIESRFELILLLAGLLAFLYSLSCFGIGILLTRPWIARGNWPTVFGLGHAIVAIILQLVAIAGFFHWYYLLPLFGGVVIALPAIYRARFAVVDWIQVFFKEDLLTKAIFSLVMLVVCLVLVAEVSYPGTDALAYYMAQPKLLAAASKLITLRGFENFLLLPFIAEIPYALMYAFGGDTIGQIASKLSIGPIFLTILALFWQIGRRLGLSFIAASFLIAAGATSTCITYLAWDGKTDLIGLMYALIAIRHIPGLIASEKLETNAILFGLFAACAIMAKMSYALVLPFVLGIPLVLLWKDQPKKLFQICIWSLHPCLIAFTLGWWIKNAVIYHDPFAPFLQFQTTTPIFPLGQAWMSLQNTHWILWTYPLAFTFGLYPMQHGGISPIWLVLLPTLWMRPWQSDGGRKALYLALGGVIGVIIWACLRPSVMAPRYFLPALMTPFFLLVFGFDEWKQKKNAIANLAKCGNILILLISLMCLGGIYKIYVDPFICSLKGEKAILGLRDRTIAISEKAGSRDICVLLSYSSEILPNNNLSNFLTMPPKDENIFIWAKNNNVRCIIYDVITHKRGDMDDVSTVAPQIVVEKIEFVKNIYYLYWLHPEPTSGHTIVNLEGSNWPPKKEILFSFSGLFLPPESWGTWSIGKEVSLVFMQALPEQFTLTLDARAFGPNIGKPISLQLGDNVQTFTLTDQFQKKVLAVKNPQRVNALKFIVPKPTSPKELRMGEDDRKLGIALKQLEIDW